MKKNFGLFTLVSVAVLMVASLAHAGPSDQDPVINMLRSKFSVAQTPTVSQLKLGQTWSCTEYDAYWDAYGVRPFSIKFNEYGDIIVNVDTKSHMKDFAYTENGLIGRIPNSRSIVGVRMTSEGDLLIENTSETNVFGEAAYTIKGRYSISYSLCPHELVKSE